MTNFRKLIPTFIVGGFFNLTIRTITPFVTPYLSSLGFTNTTISFMNSAATLAIIFITPIMGTISDRVGRKMIIFFGLLFEILAVYLFAHNGYSLIYATLAVMIISVMSMAIEINILSRVEDISSDGRRGTVTGVYESIASIGIILGPILGSVIIARSSIDNLFKFVTISFLFIIFLIFILKETSSHLNLKNFRLKHISRDFWKRDNLKGLGILGFFVSFAYPAQTVFLPLLLLKDFHLPLKYIGFFTAAVTAFCLLQFVHGWLCDKVGSNILMIIGTLIYAFSLIMVSVNHSLPLLVALLLLWSLGESLWSTTSLCHLAGIGEKNNRQGQMTSSYFAIIKMGSFLSFLISGVLVYFLGIRFLFFFYGVMLLFGIITASIYILFEDKNYKTALFKTK
ncbi:hypothetical protein COY62_01135 [bacterium (Candidatus Howlettbacteria) CG_4_10_14_0_8_um_filter_40_9]|nr:MAG: hypothetical protein COY62_01135 [bacterium (Candidatus Howlettbacteria) CG_4_10_14_0_8_um_filter_40_9]